MARIKKGMHPQDTSPEQREIQVFLISLLKLSPPWSPRMKKKEQA